MSLRRNFFAGIVNAAWTGVVGLVVIPFYLRYMGPEAYGLVGFFTTSQAIFQILDFGMAPTLTREYAGSMARNTMGEANNLMHSLGRFYWATAALILLLTAVLAPYITDSWLHYKYLDRQTVLVAVILIGLTIGFRWPIGLYKGAIMGMQNLMAVSIINMIFVSIGSIGAIAILRYVSPTVTAFFYWQALTGIAYAISIRLLARRLSQSALKPMFDWNSIRKVWRFSLAMAGVSISSVMLMQLDKVVLSRLLNLADFGRYTLASMLASGIYIILGPLFNTIYPRFTALKEIGAIDELTAVYRQGTRLLIALLFPLVAFGVIESTDIVYLWTRNHDVAALTAPLLGILLLGTSLNGVMHFPYALQLACGLSRIPLIINGILVLVLIPLTITLTIKYGALGGAIAWLLLNTLYVPIGTWLTHRVIFQHLSRKWLWNDVLIPSLVVVVGSIGAWLLSRHLQGLATRVLTVSGCCAATAFIVFKLFIDSLDIFRRQKMLPKTVNS